MPMDFRGPPSDVARLNAAANGETLRPIPKEMVRKDTFIMTDDSTVYLPIIGDLGVHGYTAIAARQAGDQLLLQAELPGFGRQMHA